jgi:hypothetical protein
MTDIDAIDVDFVPAPWEWIASVVLDGEAVLYDEATGRVHQLNGSGTIVWQLLDGGTSVGDIAGAIAEASGVDADAVTFDVVSLVRMLADLGVLVGYEPRPVLAAAPP